MTKSKIRNARRHPLHSLEFRDYSLHVLDDVVAELRAFDLRRAIHEAREIVSDTLARNRAIESF